MSARSSKKAGFVLRRFMSFKIIMDQVKALLNSPELDRVQRRILEPTGAPILPIGSAMPRWAELSLRDLTEQDFRRILTSYADDLVAFGIKIQELEDSDEEEYAPGEEPKAESEGQERVDKDLGYGNGFGLTYASYLHFLKENDAKRFIAFPKARRIPRPRPKNFYDQLRGIYEAISTISNQ